MSGTWISWLLPVRVVDAWSSALGYMGAQLAGPSAAFSHAASDPTAETVGQVLQWTITGVGFTCVSCCIGFKLMQWNYETVRKVVNGCIEPMMQRTNIMEKHTEGLGFLEGLILTIPLMAFQSVIWSINIIPYLLGFVVVFLTSTLGICGILDVLLYEYFSSIGMKWLTRSIFDVVGVVTLFLIAGRGEELLQMLSEKTKWIQFPLPPSENQATPGDDTKKNE
eukprot:2257576-Rhodomonas_salina.1